MLYEETDALSHWHLSNRVPRRKSMDWKPEVRPGGTEVLVSPLWQATPRLDIGYGQTLYRYITAIPHQENMHY